MDYDKETMYEIVDSMNCVIDADDESKFYLEFEKDGVHHCIDMKSRECHSYLQVEYCARTGQREAPSFKKLLEQKMNLAILDPKSRVHFYKRTAGNLKSQITYALHNSTSKVVIVKSDEWTIKSRTSRRFKLSKATKAQVKPVSGGNLLRLLRRYINISQNSFILYVACLVQFFCGSSDHFAMIITGEKGSGKSTMTDITRELIDPSAASKVQIPKSVDDLQILLSKSHVVSIDNAKKLDENMSNALCAAITGSTVGKRSLYTNDDEVVLRLHNAVILNGIDIVPEKSDLADRSLLFQTRHISMEKRKGITDFMEQFKKDKPQILGAIFDTLAKAISIMPTVKITKLERMADAHKEMVAIAMALGVEQSEFQQILDENVQQLRKAYAMSNEFVEYIVDYILRNGTQHGPTSAVYKKLYDHIPGGRSFFPRSASAFSRRMGEEKDALRSNGITFFPEKKSDANYITIKRIPDNQKTKSQQKREKSLSEKTPQRIERDQKPEKKRIKKQPAPVEE